MIAPYSFFILLAIGQVAAGIFQLAFFDLLYPYLRRPDFRSVIFFSLAGLAYFTLLTDKKTFLCI